MKPPRLLIGAALLFWGWQTGFFLEGAAMALILESAPFVKARWELSDGDFARIWTFCTLLFLAGAIFAFTSNEGPTNFGKLFEDQNFFNASRAAGTTGTLTAVTLIRWLPMIFFLFIAAQQFSPRKGVPLETISLILRRRWKKIKKSGQPLPPSRVVNISFPYFVICLFAASGHAAENDNFFWGLSALVGWALWSQRSRRFGIGIWAGTLGAVILLGYFGQRGIGQLARWAEEFNPQWLSHFIRERTDPAESRTQIGHIGRLKLSGKIVIRLETKNGDAPTYLREASYRSFRAQTWYAGRPKNDFTSISEDSTNSEKWTLLSGETGKSVVNIACYLNGINGQDRNPEGLLPLPPDCRRLENLAAFVLQKNSLGAVLAEGPGLLIFDAFYGSGTTIDSPADTNILSATNEDLAVSRREKPALDKIVSGLHVAGKSDEQKILAVRNFFAANFKYSLWQDTPKSAGTNATPLSRFLLTTRRGHCEYFATATVLLLRELQIPARYAVGYFVHEKSGHNYVVRLRDAHAWCLVWNKKSGVWQNFDTTPGSWIATEENQASPLQALSDFWSWLGFEFAKFRYGQSHIREYLLWALIPALGLFLYQIIFRGSRRRRRQKTGGPSERNDWPGLDSEFYRLEKMLTKRGLARQPGEPLSAWLPRAMADSGLAEELKQPLHQLLWLHYRHRFDPRGLDLAERKLLRQEVEKCLAVIAREKK